MNFNLKNTIKALLFSTSEPLKVTDVQELVKKYNFFAQELSVSEDEADKEASENIHKDVPQLLPASAIRDAIQEITEELNIDDSVYGLIEGPHGYQIAISPMYTDWIRLLRDDPKPIRLTRAVLETLAIVAYRQPATRAEMESIRGVSVDSPIQKLMELGLVCALGRADLPGRPVQYGTTDKFLEHCGIQGLEDLPESDLIDSTQLDSWMEEEGSRESVPDNQMPLPLE